MTARLKMTSEQKEVLIASLRWIKQGERSYLTIGGYAGTGKTFLITQLRRALTKMEAKTRVAFCAYTGKATRVLEAYLQANQAIFDKDNVSTIHSLIYAPITNGKGEIVGWKRKASLAYDLIIVDEASMVDAELWRDLVAFDVLIIAVGDHGQLPPIGEGSFLMKEPDLVLSEIHRQVREHPIISLSIEARTNGHIPVGSYGDRVRKIDRYDPFSGDEVESMLRRYSPDLLILTGFNHTRKKLNQQVRAYLDRHGKLPVSSDVVMCLKNNWEKQIYNGMVGQLRRVIPVVMGRQEKAYEVEIEFDADGLIYAGTISAQPFLADYDRSKSLNNGLDLFDFGYALTVHKAQGSQAKEVLLFEERSQHMNDEDWCRWLYTGVTRAEEQLTIVGRKS